MPHDGVGGADTLATSERKVATTAIIIVFHIQCEIVGLEEKRLDVLERRMRDPVRVVVLHVDELRVRLNRRQDHPVERKEQHEDDDRERQIDVTTRRGVDIR